MELSSWSPGLTCASQLYHLPRRSGRWLTSPAQSLCLPRPQRSPLGLVRSSRLALSLATWSDRSPRASPVAQVHSLAGASEKGWASQDRPSASRESVCRNTRRAESAVQTCRTKRAGLLGVSAFAGHGASGEKCKLWAAGGGGTLACGERHHSRVWEGKVPLAPEVALYLKRHMGVSAARLPLMQIHLLAREEFLLMHTTLRSPSWLWVSAMWTLSLSILPHPSPCRSPQPVGFLPPVSPLACANGPLFPIK